MVRLLCATDYFGDWGHSNKTNKNPALAIPIKAADSGHKTEESSQAHPASSGLHLFHGRSALGWKEGGDVHQRVCYQSWLTDQPLQKCLHRVVAGLRGTGLLRAGRDNTQDVRLGRRFREPQSDPFCLILHLTTSSPCHGRQVGLSSEPPFSHR